MGATGATEAWMRETRWSKLRRVASGHSPVTT